MRPLVSAVIPAFNAQRHIADAVRSALAQTYEPLEIIVVNDGSTDDTAAVLSEFASDIICIDQPNRGAAVARNEGIRRARGDYIAFLDADDRWLPGKLTAQMVALAAHADFPVAHTDSMVIDEQGQTVKPSANRRRQSRNGMVFDEFFLCPIALALTSSVVMRRECFDTLHGFNPEYPIFQDYDFFLRTALHFPIFYLDQTLVQYRLTPSSLTRTNLAANIAEQETILNRLIADHRAYFESHASLLDCKWDRFHYEAGRMLLQHGLYRESRAHFLKCAAMQPKARFYASLTRAPAPLLSRLQRTWRALRRTRS